jgi:thiol-disulfide isomerase/thioredoxin
VLKSRRRVIALAATVCAGAALVVVLLTGWASGGNGGVTDVAGSTSAVLYSAGHRPVAPDFNFWGSWCAPCRQEAPALAVTAQQYRPDGVAFLGVDVRDDTASALAFTRQFGVPYPSVSDSGSVITLDFTAVVPIAGTPTTLVIDRTGHIAGAVFGTATQQELTDILAQVMHS